MRWVLALAGLSVSVGMAHAQVGPDEPAPEVREAESTAAEPEAESEPTDARTTTAAVERQLEVGRALYLQLDFPGVIDAMTRALAVPGASHRQRLEAFEYLGAANLVIDREAEARDAFGRMLAIDPYHALREPSGSPKIRDFVERLRRERVSDAALDPELELVVDAPEAARASATMPIAVQARGAEVASVRVHHRSDEERQWRATELAPAGEGAFEGEVPTPVTTGRMLLYAEARNGEDDLVGRAGEPHWPLEVDVRDELPEPLIRQWWLWTLVGVAVVGLGVGLGVGLSQGDDAPPGTLPPGRVELP
jgi:hypothetical protein